MYATKVLFVHLLIAADIIYILFQKIFHWLLRNVFAWTLACFDIVFFSLVWLCEKHLGPHFTCRIRCEISAPAIALLAPCSIPFILSFWLTVPSSNSSTIFVFTWNISQRSFIYVFSMNGQHGCRQGYSAVDWCTSKK